MGSSTTTRNFGMRRFTNLVREGRLRAPATGDALRLGTFVEQDPNSDEYVRQAETAVVGGSDVRTITCGILWYEHDSQTLVGQAVPSLAQDNDHAPHGRLVQVLHGPGAKVWLRNTAAATTEPGLNFPNNREAVTMVDGLGGASPSITVGDLLAWDSTNGYYTATTDLTEAVLRVTAVYNDTATCDAVILI